MYTETFPRLRLMSEFCNDVLCQENHDQSSMRWKLLMTVLACERQTDGQTHGRLNRNTVAITPISISRPALKWLFLCYVSSYPDYISAQCWYQKARFGKGWINLAQVFINLQRGLIYVQNCVFWVNVPLTV